MTTMARRTSAPTLESVAAKAGVSRATAGRVLSGSTTVSEAARAAVRDAALALGYVTNHAARSLVTRRSDSVAFVVSEDEETFFADPFFATVLRGVHRAVAARNRQLMFIIAGTEHDRTKLEQFAAGGHIDGVMVGSFHGPDPLPARMRHFGLPIAQCGRPHVPDPQLAYVDSDNLGGARQATRHLLDRRELVVNIAGPADMTASQDRLAGFHLELGDRAGATAGDRVVHGDFSVDGGRAAMNVLLDRFPRLDGVFAANDLMAVGAVQALEARGRKVPDDVAVVGFDDVPLARSARPPLTTVHQPLEAMGATMANLLLDMLEGAGGPGPVLVPTELRVREST